MKLLLFLLSSLIVHLIEFKYQRVIGSIDLREYKHQCFYVEFCRQNIGIRNSLNQAIRTYVREKRLIENFSDDEMERMTLGKEALINAEMKKNAYAQKQEKSDDRTDKAKNNQLTMVDLETALSYMLRREIPRMKEIQGETYDALVNWITVLHKVGFILLFQFVDAPLPFFRNFKLVWL